MAPKVGILNSVAGCVAVESPKLWLIHNLQDFCELMSQPRIRNSIFHEHVLRSSRGLWPLSPTLLFPSAKPNHLVHHYAVINTWDCSFFVCDCHWCYSSSGHIISHQAAEYRSVPIAPPVSPCVSPSPVCCQVFSCRTKIRLHPSMGKILQRSTLLSRWCADFLPRLTRSSWP